MSETTDPLHFLPSEVVLRILDFTSTADLACLTRLNRPWHSFIDEDHQDVIYGPKTSHPPGAKDFEFLKDNDSFTKYYTGVSSWKELCKRQTLLPKNWNAESPVTRESTIQIGDHPVWRFKPDFQRRLILSTSQAGGLSVVDMDSGELLFHLPRDVVRPFAHLEYQDGTAVFDREGNSVEVWRTDDVSTRGQFTRVAVLPHEKMTRGFQLSFDTLCVVSSEGQGFVYEDMTRGQPRLKTQMTIEEGATGHLHQCTDAVAWSQATKGYHFYDKTSGQCLGVLQPAFCSSEQSSGQFFHMKHGQGGYTSGFRLGEGSLAGLQNVFPPQHPRRDRTSKASVLAGPMPLTDGEFIPLADDEWGAGMLDGNLFVGVSRGGRVFICSNWRKALQGSTAFASHTFIVECDSDGSTFDLGGWLSVRSHRVMFEIQDHIYVLGLDDQDRVVASETAPARPSFTFASCLSEQLAVPVSFMSLYEDCIMTTYTTLRHRDRSIFQLASRGRGVIPTKLIRTLSFAPDLEGNDEDILERGVADASTGQTYENLLREDMFQLVQMLADEAEDDEGDVEAVLDLEGDGVAYEDLEELD
ncbi:Putative F-box domain-containing protein [Septoria linicola]|uniref:F-box domain-containing protein n=1 Tax=Septoria linicola TaxID=215465 RepID=A0A9Q9EGA6_9PEZI|nr:putative F-box domain-containing protein [Septoria linicola]USW50626.1 Putative F-box domain-containing protein [Septoria linicola]